MMIHAAIRCPEHSECYIWPLSIRHALQLHNELIIMMLHLMPTEICLCSKSSYILLINSHPWVCPVYALEPQIQDGGKLPKWEPRSQCGKYMGASPLRTSAVILLRSLTTIRMTPKFHVVYNDLFETSHSSDDTRPAVWTDIIIFSHFKSDFDENDSVPNLANEWLTPVEVTNRHQAEQSQRSTSDGPSPLATDSDTRSSDYEAFDPRDIPDVPQRAPTFYDPPQRAPPVPDSDNIPFCLRL